MIANPMKEVRIMNTIVVDEELDVRESVHEEYEYIPHEEVVEITHQLIEKHRKAYTALANA